MIKDIVTTPPQTETSIPTTELHKSIGAKNIECISNTNEMTPCYIPRLYDTETNDINIRKNDATAFPEQTSSPSCSITIPANIYLFVREVGINENSVTTDKDIKLKVSTIVSPIASLHQQYSSCLLREDKANQPWKNF